jgi:hypothetical protein
MFFREVEWYIWVIFKPITVLLHFVCRYLYDVIYITVFVQLMSIVSEKFWWTYLVVRQHTPYVCLKIMFPFNRVSVLLIPNFTECFLFCK